jgi:endonuclease-8
MPEGDTIHHAANRIRPILAGRVPDEILTPHPRFGRDRWARRLAGRAVQRVDARGKHLFLAFEGGLVIHSHLRMTGHWGTYETGRPWRRSPRRAWLVVRADGHDVVQFDGPVLELLTEARVRFDQRMAGLGPDVLGPAWGEQEDRRFLRRLREDDPTRPIGDALLDQRTVAGLGTIWRSEGCFRAQLDPWRPSSEVSDEEALAVLHAVRPPMQVSARDGFQDRLIAVYGRDGRPCPRCGTPIAHRKQWEDNRNTYWCPGCQA